MRGVWLARGIAFLLVALLCALALWAWLRGATGCARLMGNAVYEDEDELARYESAPLAPTAHVFTDSAYDAVFPDLSE